MGFVYSYWIIFQSTSPNCPPLFPIHNIKSVCCSTITKTLAGLILFCYSLSGYNPNFSLSSAPAQVTGGTGDFVIIRSSLVSVTLNFKTTMSARAGIVALVSLLLTTFPGLCTFSEGLDLNKAEGASSTQREYFQPVKDIGQLGESPEELRARTRPAKHPRGDQAQVLSPHINAPLPSGEPHEELRQDSSETKAESPANETNRPRLKDPVASEPNLNEQRDLSGWPIGIANQLTVQNDNEVPAPVENSISQRALYPPQPAQIMYDHKEVLRYCYEWAQQYGYGVTTRSSTAGENIAIWCVRHSEGCPWSMYWRLSKKEKERGFYNVEERQGGPHNHSGGGPRDQVIPRGPIVAWKVATEDLAPETLPPKTRPMIFSVTGGATFAPTNEIQSISSKGPPGQLPPEPKAPPKPPSFPEGSSSHTILKKNKHNGKAKGKSQESGYHRNQQHLAPRPLFSFQSLDPGAISQAHNGGPNNPVALSISNGINTRNLLMNSEHNFVRPSVIVNSASSKSSSEPAYNGNGWNLSNSLERLTSRIKILPPNEQKYFIEEFMARCDWYEGNISEINSLEDVTGHYENRIPVWLSPFVKKIYDVKSDGHCGYRAVAAAVGYGAAHGWCQVRNLLVKHVTINRGFYDGPYLKLIKRILSQSPEMSYQNDIISRIHWDFEHGDCGEYHHLKLPEFGYIISSAFKRPVYLYSEVSDRGATFLPFFTNLNKLPPIAIFETKKFHYLYLEISTDVFPIYPVASIWHGLRSEVALSWVNHLQKHFSLGHQLIASNNN